MIALSARPGAVARGKVRGGESACGFASLWSGLLLLQFAQQPLKIGAAAQRLEDAILELHLRFFPGAVDGFTQHDQNLIGPLTALIFRRGRARLHQLGDPGQVAGNAEQLARAWRASALSSAGWLTPSLCQVSASCTTTLSDSASCSF